MVEKTTQFALYTPKKALNERDNDMFNMKQTFHSKLCATGIES